MEIKDRLIKIITTEGLTSAAFADSIGVQRSSISHIVSGRNNPSLDFLQKILASYPKYSAEWLIMGLGDAHRQPLQTNLYSESAMSSNSVTSKPVIEDKVLYNTSEQSKIEEISPKNSLKEEEKPIISSRKQSLNDQAVPKEKQIHKIVLFYSDKTFGEYYPES